MAAILGFLTGLLVMHLCSRKKAVYSLAAKGQANVGPTAQPAGPVYEEVSPKEEMELNTNQAYGPVGLWTVHFVFPFSHSLLLSTSIIPPRNGIIIA